MPNRTPEREFKAHVDDSVLVDLRQRLSRTRWPDEINDEGWSFGTRLPYLRSLVDYWLNNFDWRTQEAVSYAAVVGERRLLPPLDHVDPRPG